MDNDALNNCLSLAAGGDAEALHRLYLDMKSPVYLLAHTILHDAQLAEDVLQETFLHIWKSARTYRPGPHPRAWILRIARNLALSQARRRKREIVGQPSAPERAHPESNQAFREVVLEEALSALGKAEREIIVLGVLGGLTHREIARMLSIPSGSVSWKQRLALDKLRRYYISDGL